jgi:hypothetical protein
MKFETLKERHAKRKPEDLIIDYGKLSTHDYSSSPFVCKISEKSFFLVADFYQTINFHVRKMKRFLLMVGTVWSHMLLMHTN